MGKLKNWGIALGILGSSLIAPKDYTISNNSSGFVKAPNFVNGKVMNLYYETDKFSLTKEDSIEVKNYFENLFNFGEGDFDSICFEGYADSRGRESYNDSLAFRRANSLADYAKKLYPGMKTSVSSFGEVERNFTNDSLMSVDRVVKITPYKKDLLYFLDMVKNENKNEGKKGLAYLLDKSESMRSNGAWEFLQSYDYPDSSEIYAFSRNLSGNSVFKVTNIKRLSPRGETCYYLAAKNLLPCLKNKELLTIVNGEDNVGLATPQEVIDLALRNNIKMDYIALDMNPEFKKQLKLISHSTGGSFVCIDGDVSFKK